MKSSKASSKTKQKSDRQKTRRGKEAADTYVNIPDRGSENTSSIQWYDANDFPEDDSWEYTGEDSFDSSAGDSWKYTGDEYLDGSGGDSWRYTGEDAPEEIKKTKKKFNGEYAIELEGATVRFHLTTEVVSTFKEFVLRKLSRNLKYNEFFPVRDINLKVKPGESWGLIGVNGSGKSTLLKLICQILKPYRGSVKVRGSISPLIELGSGMDNELSGRKNIYLNGCILGHSKKYMEERFDEIAEFSGLGRFLDVPLKNYSSGMRARLGFSVATIVQPEILIVDEVLAVGDAAFQQKCQQRMEELRSGGTTVLFVSHSDRNIRDICDHAMWLDHGQCMMQGEVNEVCDAYLEYLKDPFRYMIGQQRSGADAKSSSKSKV